MNGDPTTPAGVPQPPQSQPPPQPLAYETPPQPQPPPLVYATPDSPEHLQPKIILIDIAIIFGLTVFGGCIAGVVAPNLDDPDVFGPLLLAALNLLMTTLGFFISGLRAPRGNRWPHLLWVALGTWLTGLVNVALGVHPAVWALGVIFIAAAMSIGGAISMAVRRPP